MTTAPAPERRRGAGVHEASAPSRAVPGAVYNRRAAFRRTPMTDSFKTRTRLTAGGKTYDIFSLKAFEKDGPEGRAPPLLSPDPSREPAPQRGRAHGHEGGRPRAREPRREGHVRDGDRLPPRARPPAGLHGRARPSSTSRDARGARPHGRQPGEDQPARAGRPRHRPLGAGGRVRDARRPSRRTPSSSSSATRSATRSSAGARTRSATSASCRPTRASATR